MRKEDFKLKASGNKYVVSRGQDVHGVKPSRA